MQLYYLSSAWFTPGDRRNQLTRLEHRQSGGLSGKIETAHRERHLLSDRHALQSLGLGSVKEEELEDVPTGGDASRSDVLVGVLHYEAAVDGTSAHRSLGLVHLEDLGDAAIRHTN